MFTRKSSPLENLLEAEMERVTRSLKTFTIGNGDYAKTLDMLVDLSAIKAKEKPESVSKDTLAVVGANLLGIVLIIKHEAVNVITSRAMNLVLKPGTRTP